MSIVHVGIRIDVHLADTIHQLNFVKVSAHIEVADAVGYSPRRLLLAYMSIPEHDRSQIGFLVSKPSTQPVVARLRYVLVSGFCSPSV